MTKSCMVSMVLILIVLALLEANARNVPADQAASRSTTDAVIPESGNAAGLEDEKNGLIYGGVGGAAGAFGGIGGGLGGIGGGLGGLGGGIGGAGGALGGVAGLGGLGGLGLGGLGGLGAGVGGGAGLGGGFGHHLP